MSKHDSKASQAQKQVDRAHKNRGDAGPAGHGIVRDELGQEQPADKRRALEVNRRDRGEDPPGHKS